MIIRYIYNKLNNEQQENLVFGLVTGLVTGLGAGEWGLSTAALIVIGVTVFLAMEIMYYLSIKKNKKKNVSLWWVLKRKLEELFETLLIAAAIINIWWVLKKYDIPFTKIYEITKQIGGYLIIMLIILGILILWLWLNKQIAIKRHKK